MEEVMNIDLCGGVKPYGNGYLNLDVIKQADIVWNITDNNYTLPFKDNEVNNIYASHIIEHFPYVKSLELLTDCYRAMNTNGYIELHTVDADIVIERLSTKTTLDREHKLLCKNIPKSIRYIFMSNYRIFNYENSIHNKYQEHKSMWTKEGLVDTLKHIGFKNIKECNKAQEHKTYDLAIKGYK